jgi:quercetin dioxygenase-like cupin family protein
MLGYLGLRRLRWVGAGALAAASLGIGALVHAEATKPTETVQSVRTLLSSGETVVGEQIKYPEGAPAKVTSQLLTMGQGEQTGWHTQGVPVFGYILEGELTVDYGDKGKRIYRTGDALLEAINVRHNGQNTGSGPVRLLVVFMGADGVKMTVPSAN